MDFVLTSDFYRVDVGLIIQRKPIFWNLTEEELKILKTDQTMIQKSGYNLEFPQHLLNFNINWFYDKEESKFENQFL